MAYRKSQQGVFQKLLQSRFVQVFLLLMIGLLSTQVFDQYQSAQNTLERREQSAAEYYQREAERQQLADQVSALHDSYVIEAEIRRHFDVAKEGEEVVIIMDPPPGEPENDQELIDQSTNRTWYRFWQY